MCLWCRRLLYNIKNKFNRKSSKVYFSPNKKKQLNNLKRIKKDVSKSLFRAKHKITILESTLNKMKNKMKEISTNSFQQIIQNNNIPKNQTDLLYEIYNASKIKNSKNRRYSENWMLLCLLFQIR